MDVVKNGVDRMGGLAAAGGALAGWAAGPERPDAASAGGVLRLPACGIAPVT